LKAISQRISQILLVLGIAFFSFFFWAKSHTLASDQWFTLKKYQFEKRTNAPDSVFSIISYNIGYLSGMSNNLAVPLTREALLSNLTKVVETWQKLQPDLVAYQEIDFDGKRAFHLNQSDTLAKAVGFPFALDAVNWDKRYLPFPFALNLALHYGRILSGQTLHSRFELTPLERKELQRIKTYNFFYDAFYIDRLAMVAKVQIQQRSLIIINVHLEAFDRPTRLAQVKEVLALFRAYAKIYPVILLGDFNAHAPTKAYRQSKDYEPTIDLLLNEPNLKAACPPENFSQKGFFTYSSANPAEHIDYIFYTPATIEIIDYKTLTEVGTASDHLPVWAKWKFKN